MKGILNEIRFFKSHEHNMKVLLLTNMIYGFVLPVVEIFAGAYVMRDTNDPAMVAYYQLAMYVGVVFTSMVNGFFEILKRKDTLFGWYLGEWCLFGRNDEYTRIGARRFRAGRI